MNKKQIAWLSFWTILVISGLVIILYDMSNTPSFQKLLTIVFIMIGLFGSVLLFLFSILFISVVYDKLR